MKAKQTLEEWACLYAAHTAEIKRLTAKLRETDDRGDNFLGCLSPERDPATHNLVNCRTRIGLSTDPNGNEQYLLHRDLADWCLGCRAVEEIVKKRKQVKTLRGIALRAIGNYGRARLSTLANEMLSHSQTREA